MNPLSIIKRGIKEADWHQVVQGYNAITGDDVSAPIVSQDEDSPITVCSMRQIVVEELTKVFNPIMACLDLEHTVDAPNDTTIIKQRTSKGDDSLISESGEFSGAIISETIEKVTHYGTKPTLITGETDEETIETNKQKASARALKVKRAPPRTYKVECNECREEFESDRKAGEIGQKCHKCLRTTRQQNG